MAGSDQSVNLGGMLSQMNSAIGEMGAETGKQLGQVIANANMPKVDPKDPQSMHKYAEWARRNGKPQEALTMQLQAQKAEKEMQDKAVAQAKANMIGQYHTAVKSGEGEQEAYDNLVKFGANAGEDMTRVIDQIDAGERARQDQEYQAAQQEKAKARDNAQQMAMGAMTGKTEAEIEAVIQKAPAQFRDIYQEVGRREVAFQNEVQRSKDRKADIKTPVDTKGVTSAIEQIENPELSKRFSAELEQLEESKGNYWNDKQKTWHSPAAKTAWEKEVSRLHRSAFDAVTREVINKENREADLEEDFQRALGKARGNKVTETEIENYTEAVAQDDGVLNVFGYKEIDRDTAIAGVIAERERGVREAYGRAEAPVDGGNEQPTGIPEGWTPEEWNALTPEEQASLR